MTLILVVLGWTYAAAMGRGEPGTVREPVGAPGPGIYEKVFVNINGVSQGMFIEGRDLDNPVLLYLHGGLPDYFLTERYPTGLEEYFTICWWEQRGAGLSYDRDAPKDSITVEQLIADTIAVTDYLRSRFGQAKIYLMGHSGGTFIGIQAAQRAPQLYHAYLGVAQASNQLNSERLAYDYMLSAFRSDGNARMVRKLEAAPVTGTESPPASYLAVRDTAMHRLGIGTTRDTRSVLRGVFLRSLRSSRYSLSEKINMWRAKASSGVSIVWDALIATDLSSAVPRLEVPVYFFEGIHDYTCSYTEARAYFESLSAPVKGFYTFHSSAHSPLFEEPARMQLIVREDVLTGTIDLADEYDRTTEEL